MIDDNDQTEDYFIYAQRKLILVSLRARINPDVCVANTICVCNKLLLQAPQTFTEAQRYFKTFSVKARALRLEH